MALPLFPADLPLVFGQTAGSGSLGDIGGLANLAGYAFAAVVFLGIIREGFKAWKAGDFVPKAQHDEIVAAGAAREARLQTMVDVMVKQQDADTAQMRVMGDLLTAQGATMRELLAAVRRLREPKGT